MDSDINAAGDIKSSRVAKRGCFGKEKGRYKPTCFLILRKI